MKSIIWDWNGTLLNDIELCIKSINILLKNRNIPEINTETYRNVFSFPVKEYYKTIGFDLEKEDFSIPAHQFIDLYNAGFNSCTLQKSAFETLTFFKGKGVPQFVLSAMEHNMLEKTLKLKGISHFFDGISGLNDNYAVSKIELGRKLITDFKIDTDNVWLIGDTLHDFEVAIELGIKCILIADGHQSTERLLQTGGMVIGDLSQLITGNILEI